MTISPENIENIFQYWCEDNPEPETELEYSNGYTLLVAVVLSAQATDVGVNKATKKLFALVDSPQKMLDLGLDNLKKHIKTIGLYNNKAKNVISLSHDLIDKFNGETPDNHDDLISLAGVGTKTANVVLNCLFGQKTIAVDTHVFRVSNRIGLVNTKSVDVTEAALLKVIPEKYQYHAHHWLILHGRYICKARKPECDKCNIAQWCEFI